MKNRIERLEEVKKAAEQLLEKLDKVEKALEPLYFLGWSHGMEYKGPTYKEEKEVLIKALEKVDYEKGGSGG